MTGWKTPTKIQTGLRSSNCIWRLKISEVSRSSFIFSALPQRSAGLGEEHVVEAGAVQFDGAQRDAGQVEGAQDLRDGHSAVLDVEAHTVLVRVGLVGAQGLHGRGDRVDGQSDPDDVARDLA